jgi:vacuolar protein-sorting-associated protein 4
MTDFLSKGIEHGKKARTAEKEKDNNEALRYYILAIDYLIKARDYCKDDVLRDTISRVAADLVKKAEELKDGLEKKGTFDSVLLHESPNVKWDDIAGLFEAKKLLQQTVDLPRLHPHLFDKERKPWTGILMYGPSGTGKSFLAKAVATAAPSAFFSVSSADLVSKWLGDSEKNMHELFQTARARRPSVIFIDEIDALCQARGGNQEHDSSKRMLNQLLIELDGVGNSMDGVLFLGATNTPWAIDSAMRSRFQKRVYVPLPDAGSRALLFRKCLGTRADAFTTDDFHTLSALTENYSGRDIKTAVNDAIYAPLTIMQDATHFKRVTAPNRKDVQQMREYWTPCSPGDPEGEERGLSSINGDDSLEPPLTLSHLRQSIVTTRPTVSSGDLERFVAWTREFGQDG